MTIADERGRQYGADVSYSLKIEGVAHQFTDGRASSSVTGGQHPVDSDCLALWRMDETSGAPQDTSGNAHHLIESAAGVLSQTGKFGGARGPYTNLNRFAIDTAAGGGWGQVQEFTLALWAYVASTSQYRYAKLLTQEYNHIDNAWSLMTVNGDGSVDLQPNNSIFQFTAVATDGTVGAVTDTKVQPVGWHHFVVSVDGSQTMRMYIDGDLIGTSAALAGKALRYDSQFLFFGSDLDYAYQAFNGYLDDVAFYGAAKSGAWVKMHAQGLPALIPPSSELSTGLDLKTMKVDASSLEIQLANVRDPDDTTLPKKYYFAKLFAPGRTSATGVISSPIRRQDADDVQVDANATTIYVQSKTGFATSGTAYIGNETFSYTGVDTETQTNFPQGNQDIGKFTGCTRGLYPALGTSNRGRTYAYPITGDDLAGDVGDYDVVSSEPYTMIGREVGIYATARDPDTGEWFATPSLVWAGKIAEDITYDPKSDTWNLTAENILASLEAMIPRRTPKAFVHDINLNGDLGREWRVFEYDSSNTLVARGTFELDAGYYTVESLQNEIADELKAAGNWADEAGESHYNLFDIEWRNANDGRVTMRVIGWDEGTTWKIDPSPLTKKYQPCHAWQALGFPMFPWSVSMVSSIVAGTSHEASLVEAAIPAFPHYHPTNPDYNGSVMRCKFTGSDKLWTDQGDWGTTLAWLRVEDQPVAGLENDDGEYVQAYSAWALDSGDNYELTLSNPPGVVPGQDVDPKLDWSKFGFVGSRDRFGGLEVQNAILPCQSPLDTQVRRGPLEMLLFPLLSSGTQDGYNDATYDQYPFDASVHFPADLVDKDSFTAADATIMPAFSDLADRTYYPLHEGDPWSDLMSREAILFGLCLAWDPTIGKIAIKQIAAPRMHLAEQTLSEATRAQRNEYPRVSSSSKNVVNIWKVDASYRNGKPMFTGTFRDPVSVRALGERETKIDHPGLRAGPMQIKGLLDALFRNRSMINRYPHQRVTTSVAPKLARDLSIGDVITYQADSAHPDPLGSGTMTCDTEGIVIDLRWALKNPGSGVAELMLIDHTVYPWGAAAMVDYDATNGGWNDADDELTLLPLQFGEAGDLDDGAAFGDTHKVLVLESAPEDPSSAQVWGPFAVTGAYEDDGANILTLPPGTTLAGWDSTKEHVVICAEYTDAVATQRLLNTFQADAITHLLDGSDSAQRYG